MFMFFFFFFLVGVGEGCAGGYESNVGGLEADS